MPYGYSRYLDTYGVGSLEVCRTTMDDINVCAFCGKFTNERHHMKRRSQGGSDDRANILYVCRAHHNWIHANINDSKELGLIISVWDEEHKEPILRVSRKR